LIAQMILSSLSFQINDLLVGNALQVLHQSPQAIAMCQNQYLFLRPDAGGNQLMPARQKTLHRVLEAFGNRKLLFWDVFIARIVPRKTWVRLVQRRRANVVTPAPELLLLVSVGGSTRLTGRVRSERQTAVVV
jgi:hypothetical protein